MAVLLINPTVDSIKRNAIIEDLLFNLKAISKANTPSQFTRQVVRQLTAAQFPGITHIHGEEEQEHKSGDTKECLA